MRANEFIAENEKMSFAHAKEFLQDIEQGQGRIKELAIEYPWLVNACQKALKQKVGDTISVYRAISGFGELKQDEIASTSLNWKVAWDILYDAPGMVFHGDEMKSNERYMLHYKIKVSDAMIWVPFAMEYVKKAVGKRTNYSIEDRRGERMKIQAIYDWMAENDEQEIIADLSKYKPKALVFPSYVAGNVRFRHFREVMEGKHPDPKAYIENPENRWDLSGMFVERIDGPDDAKSYMKFRKEIADWAK